jgi:hypothetical protein
VLLRTCPCVAGFRHDSELLTDILLAVHVKLTTSHVEDSGWNVFCDIELLDSEFQICAMTYLVRRSELQLIEYRQVEVTVDYPS